MAQPGTLRCGIEVIWPGKLPRPIVHFAGTSCTFKLHQINKILELLPQHSISYLDCLIMYIIYQRVIRIFFCNQNILTLLSLKIYDHNVSWVLKYFVAAAAAKSLLYFLWSFTPLGKTFRVKETKRRNVFWWLTQFTSMYGRCIHI